MNIPTRLNIGLKFPISTIFILINLSYFLPVNFASLTIIALALITIRKIYAHLFLFVAFFFALIVISSIRGFLYFNELNITEPIRLMIVILVLTLTHNIHRKHDFQYYFSDLSSTVLFAGVLSFLSLANYFSTFLFEKDWSFSLFEVPLQHYTFRLIGLQSNPNNNAFYLGSSIIFLLALQLKNWSVWHVISLICILLMIILSGSRGMIAASIASVIFFISMHKPRLVFFLSTCIAVSLFATSIFFQELDIMSKVLGRLDFKDFSSFTKTQSRFEIWEDHWKVIISNNTNFLIGIGAPGYLNKVTDGSLIRYITLFGVPLGVGLFLFSIGIFNLLKVRNIVFGISFFLFMFPNLLVNDWVVSKVFGLIIAVLFLANEQKKLKLK